MALASLWLLAGCTLEVAPDYSRPFVGQVDAASGGLWTLDAVEAEAAEIDQPFGVDDVLPARGDPAGGDKVVLRGHDFRQTDRVFFDEVEASEVRFQGPERLVAFTPPHPSGLARVSVRHQEGDEAVAPLAFLFTREPRLLAIEPDHAGASGGDPVTMRFAALDADATVLIASRQLAAPSRDGDVVSGVLPPLDDGANDVLVVTPGKTWRFEGALRADQPLTVARAEPMAVPAATGGDVALVGHGLLDARVFIEGVEGEVVARRPDGTLLSVRVPAGAAGALRVDVVGEAGVVAAEGLVHRDGGGGAALLGVYPSSGDAAGGVVLALAFSGVDGASVARVTVCDAEAAIVARPEGGVLVTSPPVPPGACDVRVEVGGGPLVALAAYSARAATARVEGLSPAEGPAVGGTAVRLSGWFPGGIEEATLCGLPLVDLRPDGPEGYAAVTPAGSPGDCPLVVLSGGQRASGQAAFRYRAGQTRLLAVADDEGSRAGGTLVRVLGTDLPTEGRVVLGGVEARVEAATPSALLVRTPPVESARVVDVAVIDGTFAARLPQAYAYADLATEEAGTWGGPVRGTVNVHVLHSSTREPVPDAHVAVLVDDGSFLRARTDDHGQAVFSELGLTGRVSVTASRNAYAAYTIAGFDARNVTLALRGPVPPPTGSDGPPDEPVFKPATVTGTVLGLDKYVPPAWRACEAPEDDGACAPCISGDDCAEGLACLDVGATGTWCLPPCTLPEGACPDRFACLPADPDDARCFPVLGPRRTFCFASDDGPGGQPVTVEQGALVSSDDAFYLAGVRLGEIAILCLAGYEDALTHTFVPQTLGAARHLFTMSDTLLGGVTVALDTPLGPSPPFELTGYVVAPDAFPAISAWITLDLGSDGALALPGWARGVDERHVLFPTVPLSLQGTFYDASFDLEVHAGLGGSSYAPYAEAYRYGLAGFAASRTYAFEGGRPGERALSMPLNFTSLAVAADGEVLAATDDGRVLRQRWGTWYAEPVAGKPIVRGLAARGDAVVGVGDDGVLVRRVGDAWSLPTHVTDRALRAVALEADGGLVAVGDARLVVGPPGSPSVSKIADHLRAVTVTSAGVAWAAGLGGVVWRREGADWQRSVLDPSDDLLSLASVGGEVFVGARSGRVWRLREDGGADPVGERGAPVSCLAGGTSTLLAGVQGGLDTWDGQAWTRAALAVDFLPTGIAVDVDAPATVVGSANLALGPVLPPVTFVRPARRGTWSGRALSWQFPGGVPPGDYQLLSLYDYFGDLAWTLLLAGGPTSYALAPLDAWGEYDPLDRPALRLQYARVVAPGFDLDRTNGYEGGYRSREAVLYDYFELLRR